MVNKAIYLALAVTTEGKKELLGIWISQNEGAKFWLTVFTELKNRGLHAILIACVDGLIGFDDALLTAFPDVMIQTCIVHMVRRSTKYVSYKERKILSADLKTIYQASDEKQALLALISSPRSGIRNFPDEESAIKVMYLAAQNISKKWTMPIRNWGVAFNWSAIESKGRLPLV